jgi:hypothetical protein
VAQQHQQDDERERNVDPERQSARIQREHRTQPPDLE